MRFQAPILARAGLLMILLALTACGSLDTYPKPSDFPVHGIDVSNYQGDIAWSEVKASGIDFVFIKATEGGDHLDARFSRNWADARATGLPRGAYHFYFWCRPAEEQAAWFLQNVPNDPDALPPVLDVEWNGHSRLCPQRLPRAEALAHMRTFLTLVEQSYGRRPIIYTSIDFYHDVIKGDLHDYPLWVRSVRAFPAARYGERNWMFWQYTDQGRAAGIKGPVDRNAFAGSKEHWRAFVEGTNP
jgi:lysozyme